MGNKWFSQRSHYTQVTLRPQRSCIIHHSGNYIQYIVIIILFYLPFGNVTVAETGYSSTWPPSLIKSPPSIGHQTANESGTVEHIYLRGITKNNDNPSRSKYKITELK